MTSIGSYSLSNYLSGNSGGATNSSAASSILQALQQGLSSSSSSRNASAYLLNLSPAAQQVLSNSSSSASTQTGSTSDTKFTLDANQQAAIKNIVAKYKDAPFTQTTFDSILSDLQKAGLSPQTLAAKDQVKSFNPTSQLLSALSGNYSGPQTPSTTAAGEDTKKNNYLQSIVSLWQSTSTVATSNKVSA